jgi:malate synthase
MAYFLSSRPQHASPVRKSIFFTTVVLLLAMLLSACSGDPQAQQQATTQHTHLNTSLAHARDIGVPASMLAPIVKQEQALQKSSAPFSLFSDSPATDYYNNLAQRYQQLAIEVTGLETKVTQQFDYQAYRDIQDFENALTGRQAQGFVEVKTFAAQLAQDQTLLAKARYPKDYLQISNSAQRSTLALHLMGPAYDQLQSLLAASQQLNASHVGIISIFRGKKNQPSK